MWSVEAAALLRVVAGLLLTAAVLLGMCCCYAAAKLKVEKLAARLTPNGLLHSWA